MDKHYFCTSSDFRVSSKNWSKSCSLKQAFSVCVSGPQNASLIRPSRRRFQNPHRRSTRTRTYLKTQVTRSQCKKTWKCFSAEEIFVSTLFFCFFNCTHLCWRQLNKSTFTAMKGQYQQSSGSLQKKTKLFSSVVGLRNRHSSNSVFLLDDSSCLCD